MKKKPLPRMRGKIIGRVLLILLTLLLLAVVVIGVCYREEISLLLYVLRTDQEDVSARQSENDAQISSVMEALGNPELLLRDLTEEERALLADGKITAADALCLIRGEKTLEEILGEKTPSDTPPDSPPVTFPPVGTEPPPGEEIPAETESSDPPAAPSATQTRIDELLAQIYLLRATYLNEIDTLVNSLKQEYLALPKKERSATVLLRYADRLATSAAELEKKCDAEMESILSELQSLLAEQGDKTDLVGQIRDAYAEQKRLKKTEMLNRYKKYLK